MLCRCPVDHRRGTAQIFERLNSIIFCTLRHRSLQLGEDALFMSQPDEVIDDEDEEQHQQAPPQQKLLRQSPRRSKRNRR